MDCTVSRRENISNLEGWNWLRAKARVLSATKGFPRRYTRLGAFSTRRGCVFTAQ